MKTNNYKTIFGQMLIICAIAFGISVVALAQTIDSPVRRGPIDFSLTPRVPDPLPNPNIARICPKSALVADVVAIDHPMVFNRLGAQNVNWMMYALRHDVIDLKTNYPLDYTAKGESLFAQVKANNASRDIALRPDLRPRPLVLRVAEGGYLRVRFTNLLETKPLSAPTPQNIHPNQANPFDSYPDPLPGLDHPLEHAAKDPVGTLPENKLFRLDDQVASRYAGFHPQGLEVVNIESTSSYVGNNPNSLAPPAGPGQTQEYCFYAPKEGAYLVSSDGASFGGEGTAGNSGVGLFGAVTVQPKKARFYRAQVTEEEMRLATATHGRTAKDQPIIDYEATYPNNCAQSPVWCEEGKAGLPILSMVQNGRIIHGDINAIIVGPGESGMFPKVTYPLELQGKRNPALPNRLEPFREFVSIFHDENAATQAFPYFFGHPELSHTLHGVRDAFMINYGSGGVGAEIIANRLKAGPMQDCIDCAYEEFFLSSFAVGDPAMLVDKPTNLVISQCQPEYLTNPDSEEFKQYCTQPKGDPDDSRGDQRATQAFYPHDPANVHHSYIGDFVKFRNMHSGKEQHIFHLHNHQWLFNPNDDNSNYIDAQGIGPGSGYTYEIAYGGSGNRNKTVGDAIFHCHFYPHFAQGMWYLWRNHDVFEQGTPLAVSQTDTGFHKNPYELHSGLPAEVDKKLKKRARALPDGEIAAGTPIPAVVPLPSKGMALMPAEVSVNPRIGLDGKTYGSVAEVKEVKDKEDNPNPGYPFWVAGVANLAGAPTVKASVGSRPTTPPLDMSEIPGVVKGHDGGLPRHTLAGFSADGKADMMLDRMSAEKHLLSAMPVYFPEDGTDLEKIAMNFHATPRGDHKTYKIDMVGNVTNDFFITNGASPVPGAPYSDPCIDDTGTPTQTGTDAKFFGGTTPTDMISAITTLTPNGIEFGGDKPRVYKGANLQLDVVFNKVGYHYPQQRILTLWEDVAPLLDKTNPKPPEPLVLRLNTFDCAMYAHTNLVPKDFYVDDYQITTPTDVIGQHIHLPKWDLPSADGSANGWNYEDGTFSPGMVRERITAINTWNTEHPADSVEQPNGSSNPLVPAKHPYFGNLAGLQLDNCETLWEEADGDADKFDKLHGHPGQCDWLGARTTLQRWFSDPLVNAGGIHRGLGITFTHDHLGPSTHQQLGLYATMLTEPPGSEWRHNETGQLLYDASTRNDGGPTSWQAVITNKKSQVLDVDEDGSDDSHREFFLQFGDFQHAYQKGQYFGVDQAGIPKPPTKDSFREAINPSVRKPSQPMFPDIIAFEPDCPGGTKGLPGAVYSSIQRPLRPCPEAISADDIGMMVVNYRNEPVGLRTYDPNRPASDGKLGNQATGFKGDLTFALQTRTDRALTELNDELGVTPYPLLTNGILKGDPFTPILRAYSGDLIRVKVQAGSHEHEHNGSINALGWMQSGSGFGQAPHSGWRNAQNTGLSEQFTFSARITDYFGLHLNDRLYTVDSSQDGLWNGVWGILRSSDGKEKNKDPLVSLPSNPLPTVLAPKQGIGYNNVCPANAKVRHYYVAAVLANVALDNSLGVNIPQAAADAKLNPRGGTLIYNPRATTISIEFYDENQKIVKKETYGSGPLHDPTAILFVRAQDLDANNKILPGRPVEPLVLRAAAGECIQVILHNRLPWVRSQMADLDGYTTVSGIVRRDPGSPGSKMTTFNNNLIRPSNRIGLHPQLVHYDVQGGDGNNVGVNHIGTIAPGWGKIYQWYAGALETSPSAEACPKYAAADINSKFDILNIFSKQPALRPLTELLTATAYQEVATEILDPNYAVEGITKPQVQVLAKQLTSIAQDSGCLDEVPAASASISTRTLVAGYINTDDEAPLLGSDTYFDPDPLKTIDKRLACVKKLTIANIDFLQNLYPKDFRTLAAKIAGVIAFQSEGIEDLRSGADKAYAWRLPSYPDLTSETTRLAQLSRSESACRYVGVEFGGTNLTPPDRIKQGQKAAVGALIIEPKNASWKEVTDDQVIDRQNPGINQVNKRISRATAIVSYPAIGILGGPPSTRSFRDFALVHQKGLNFRYAKGDAVANLAAEKVNASENPALTAPEDAHDSGHMAINYGSEPLWFRFGLPPDAPFGKEGFGGVHNAWQAFSNQCCDNGGTAISADANVKEPYMPILTVPAGSEMRIRALMPTGIGRASTVQLYGHRWMRDPYLAEVDQEGSNGSFPMGHRPFDWKTPATCIGQNILAITMGGQESVSPMAHYDMVFPHAGGIKRITGDYLWRDHAGFGITNGLWALVRVEKNPTFPSPGLLRTNCQ
jgi:hypothetical protein